MNKIGKRFGSLIVWASAYVSVIVFALCGWFAWFKSDDETIKQETKKALIVTLICTAVGMVQLFVGQCLSMFGVSYGSDLYTAHQIIGNIVTIAKIVVYAVFALLAFFKAEKGADKNAPVALIGRSDADVSDRVDTDPGVTADGEEK